MLLIWVRNLFERGGGLQLCITNISVIKYMSNLLYNNKISTNIVFMHILTFYFLYIFIKKNEV